MERFWNTVYYFAYRADIKLTWYFYKYTGAFLLLNLSFMRKRYEKGGIKDPVAHLMEAHKRPDIGLSRMFASALIGGIWPGLIFIILLFHYVTFIDKPQKFEPVLIVFISYSIIAFLFNYILLWHKDKYLKYFKEFSKKPRKWKVKWAWISLGVILFPFVVLILGFMVMAN